MSDTGELLEADARHEARYAKMARTNRLRNDFRDAAVKLAEKELEVSAIANAHDRGEPVDMGKLNLLRLEGECLIDAFRASKAALARQKETPR